MAQIKDSRGSGKIAPLQTLKRFLREEWDNNSCKVAAAVIGAAVVTAGVGAAASSSAASKQANAATSAAQASLDATEETNQLNYQIYMQNLANLSPQMQIQQEAESALASGLGLGTPNTGTTQMFGSSATGTAAAPTPFQSTTGGVPATATAGGQPPMAQATSFLGAGTTATPTTGTPTASPSAVMGTASGPPVAVSSGNTTAGVTGSPLTAANPSGSSAPVPGVPAGGSSVASPGIPGSSTNYTGINTNGIVNAGASQSQLNSGGASQPAGSLLANFNNTDLNSQLAPSYGFILGQGQTELDNYNAAHGISGGNAVNAEESYTQNTASTYYQQAFQNYLTQQQQNLSSLSSLAGNGATFSANAAGTSAGATIGTTTMSGVNSSNNYLTGAAAASAAGTVGEANALTGAIGQGTSGLLVNKLISQSQTQQQPAASSTPMGQESPDE